MQSFIRTSSNNCSSEVSDILGGFPAIVLLHIVQVMSTWNPRRVCTRGEFPAWFMCMRAYVCVNWNFTQRIATWSDCCVKFISRTRYAHVTYYGHAHMETPHTNYPGSIFSYGSRITYHASRTTHHALRITHYASRAHGDIVIA